MYKVIFDRADASKSHAIAFDEQAEYPGLSKEKDGSCAQYGYDKYPGVVYCTSAEGFLSFLRMSLALTTGYWDRCTYETLEDKLQPLSQVKKILNNKK